jgi:hypothetical protein
MDQLWPVMGFVLRYNANMNLACAFVELMIWWRDRKINKYGIRTIKKSHETKSRML